MDLYSEGLIIGRIFSSEIWGAYFSGDLSFCGVGEGGGGYHQNITVTHGKFLFELQKE